MMTLKQALKEIIEREHPITVRGAFYRAVSAGLFPGTDQEYYKTCAKLIKRIREDGALPYEWIIDSSRTREESFGYSGLDSFIDSIRRRYRRNYWDEQPIHLEVCTEKDAMSTILQPVIEKWNVPFSVFRGNPSDTLCHDIGYILGGWKLQDDEDRAEEEIRGYPIKPKSTYLLDSTKAIISKPAVFLYLGDFDPSGLNISRTARRKIQRFAGRSAQWVRVAINSSQFLEMKTLYGIPTKKKDRTANVYIADYGDVCVEVDAMPSDEVRNLLDKAIEKRIDMDAWEKSKQREQEEQQHLESLVSKIRPDL